MTDQLSLDLYPQETRVDLPPLWDGVPVDWMGWSRHDSTLILHLPVDAFACRECGSIEERDLNFGKRGPFRNLTAFRCRHCRHDQVLDDLTGETWDLDETDYQPTGSHPPPGAP